MEATITRIVGEFTKKLIKTLVAGVAFHEAEQKVPQAIAACAAKITGVYFEQVDKAITKDKYGRRQAGYTVERRGDKRTLLTTYGEVTYSRTYYRRESGGYEYLADTTLGIDRCRRVSEGVGLELVNAAKDMSYAKASRYIGGKAISRQTVMSLVRSSTVAENPELTPLRKVPELHIGADEAHVTVGGGKRTEVPLISIYEGIWHQGKRNSCKNVFHISEYGKTPYDLWEQVADEIVKRYDLEGTQIYLHGDGAPWIRTGLEWFPKAIFVLDKYHKNKAITSMTAGLDKDMRNRAEHCIRKALDAEDIEYFAHITESLCQGMQDRTEIILESAEYLKRFVKGISICAKDPRADNSGCTEPHVSHILASRLSTRPMAWSKATLQKLAPILAAGKVDAIGKTGKKSMKCLPKSLQKTMAKARKVPCRSTLGLPAPEAIGTLPITGKVTGLQVILKAYAG